MSKKSSSPVKTNTPKVTSTRQLWKSVTPSTWLRTLQARAPSHQWVQRGNRIQGCCPYHRETSPSFHIDLERGFAKCFGGSCGKYKDDPLELLADILKVSDHEVLTDVVQGSWGVTLPKTMSSDLAARKERLSLRQALMDVCHASLLEAVQAPTDPAWAWAQPTVQWLAHRGLDTSKLEGLPIGVLPTRQIMWSGLSSDAHRKQFASYLGETLVPERVSGVGLYTGALTFHHMLSPVTPGCIKVRKPSTSGSKEIVWAGDDGDEEHGIFGLDTFISLIGKPTTVYVVEGEFDQLSMLRAQMATYQTLTYGVVAAGGSSIPSLDVLTDMGCEEIRLVGDYDEGGLGFTRIALQKTQKGHISAYDWASGSMAESPGIDPDELVKGGLFHMFEADRHDESLWLPRHAWVAGQLRRAAETLRNDLPALQKTIEGYTGCLHALIDKDAVYQELKNNAALPSTVLQASLMSNSTDEMYISMLARHLQLEMRPLAVEGMNAVVYVVKDGRVVTMPLNRKGDLLTVLNTQVLHAAPYEWCRERLGDPEWLVFGAGQGEERIALPYTIRAERNNELLIQAMARVCAELPPKSQLTMKKQGVHCRESADGARTLYVVNGTHVYRGEVALDGTVIYSELDTPVDNGWLFMSGRGQAWSTAVTGLDRLNAASEESPAEIYACLKKMLIENWTFSTAPQRQELEASYLAAVAMYVVIAQGFPYVSQILLQAPSNTGKSKLLMGIFSGTQFDKIKIVEHAIGMDAYTVAGVFQSMDGAGYMLCLDEFEMSNARDQKRQKIVSDLLSTMRMNYASGTRKVQGSANQEASEQGFRAPVMAAAISGFDRIEDANRWNTITLHNLASAAGPDERILRTFSQDDIRRIREACTLLPLQQYGVIRNKYEDLHARYGTLQGLPEGTGDRLLQPMLPVVAVMDWCGVDVHTFLPQYLQHKIESNRADIRAEHQQILHDLLNTPAVIQPGDVDRMKCSVATILQSSGGAATINATSCGIYVTDLGRHVVIVLSQAYHVILRTLERYRAQNLTFLKKQLQQHPKALREREVQSERILESVRRYVSIDTNAGDIIALPIDQLVYSGRIPEVVFKAPDADVVIATRSMPSIPEVDEDDSVNM